MACLKKHSLAVSASCEVAVAVFSMWACTWKNITMFVSWAYVHLDSEVIIILPSLLQKLYQHYGDM